MGGFPSSKRPLLCPPVARLFPLGCCWMLGVSRFSFLGEMARAFVGYCLSRSLLSLCPGTGLAKGSGLDQMSEILLECLLPLGPEHASSAFPLHLRDCTER